MGKRLNEIKELILEFAKDFTPIMNDEERERQGITVDESIWLANALLFFQTHINGASQCFKYPKPTYDDREPSEAMVAFDQKCSTIAVLLLCRLETRERKQLQEQLAAKEKELAQRDSKIQELQEELALKNKRICQFKRTIVELRDTMLTNEDDSFVHIAPEPVNEFALFHRLFKKT